MNTPIKTARLYHCACCQIQVLICSHCDRGNIYCNTGCATAARKKKQKEANARYQSSSRGRKANAARQRRYRQQLRENSPTPQSLQKEKVTDQGSPKYALGDVLPLDSSRVEKTANVYTNEAARAIHCHFCGGACSAFVRLDALRPFHSRHRLARSLTLS